MKPEFDKNLTETAPSTYLGGMTDSNANLSLHLLVDTVILNSY